MPQRQPVESANSTRTVKTVCSHDCPDACSVLVDVRDGRAVSFRGDPGHPFTRGFLCGKVNGYERVVYSEGRLRYPMRRVGRKGEGSFQRISWPEAIDAVTTAMEETWQRSGGEALFQYFYGGTMGLVQRWAPEALFHRLGASRVEQNICYYGADAGYNAVVGGGYGVDPEDTVHSDLLLVWGCNVVSTQVHLIPFFDEARKRGARLVVVDPYRNRSAVQADEHIKIRPGTDAALALAMAHVIEAEGLADSEFLESRTFGYEKFRSEVLVAYAPRRVAEITGIESETIVRLAREYADASAPLIKFGIGLGRNSNGASGVRAICCLAGMVGAYTHLGGGVLYDSGCEFKVNMDAVTRPDWLEKPTRVIAMTDIAEALNDYRDPPIDFLYVHGSNPVATAPEQNRVISGLEREDLFTVVHERFLTDTAIYADIVLPAPTFAEVDDLYRSYGHLYLQMGRAAVPPLGESKSNLEVIQAFGKALGFEDSWFSRSVDDLVCELLDTEHPNFEGISVERLLAGETARLNIPRGVSGYRNGFPTPSGKLEFYSEALAEQGMGLPGYLGDVFGTDVDRHPLRLITPPAHHFLNASFGASEESRRRQGDTPVLLVHPEDAGRYGVVDGGRVELLNDLGRIEIRVCVSEDTVVGVVVAEGTWWPSHSPGGRGINALTSARLTDFGRGSTFHDNRVAIRPLE